MPAFEHAYPCFLKEIFRALVVAGQMNEISKQPILIPLDQAVEQVGIAPLQAAGDSCRVVFDHRGEKEAGPRSVQERIQSPRHGRC